MKNVAIFVYYDWDKPHTVLRPEKPIRTEGELLLKLSKGQIAGFDITGFEYINGKRIRVSLSYRLDDDSNVVITNY